MDGTLLWVVHCMFLNCLGRQLLSTLASVSKDTAHTDDNDDDDDDNNGNDDDDNDDDDDDDDHDNDDDDDDDDDNDNDNNNDTCRIQYMYMYIDGTLLWVVCSLIASVDNDCLHWQVSARTQHILMMTTMI